MRLPIRTLFSFAIGACVAGAMMLPGPAAAGPVSVDEYNAAFSQALEESGLYAPDTTVTVEYADHFADWWYVNVVNPDGSLLSTASSEGLVSQVKCVRPDRCWRRAPYKYNDGKWHLVSAGSVSYESLRAQLSTLAAEVDETPENEEWTETFAVDGLGTGQGIFTITVADPELTVVVSDVLAGPRLTMALTVSGGGLDGTTAVSGVVQVQAGPVPITAPPQSRIGAPAPRYDTSFTVAIN
ncbi:MAG: hypothetical protein GC156_15935 [Actinomycetales bacterium]|nr:hypothetical protein [Actinomycetales bacterium]